MPGAAAAVRDSVPEPQERSGRHCFTRHLRLTQPRQFQHVHRHRDVKRAQGRFAYCLWVANGLPHARLGLAVSKRALSRSVARNLFKRLVRECFRLDPPVGVDLIVGCRHGVRQPLDRRAVRADLEHLWRKIGP